MDDSQDTTFTTFNDPPSLFDAVSQTLNDSTSTLPTHIRVCIMAPLDGKTLTETELNGGIDGPDCPNLEHLVEEWRTSFRQIPQGHSITHLQFDMSTPQEMELRHIVRLLQALIADSTVAQIPRPVAIYAQILGAFFNAVFLIALCLSIILEAITRFVDIQTITNPQLILIVGSLGLASNIVGFFVLGGHGHSHGPEEHAHGHEGHTHDDDIRTAEEGQIGAPEVTSTDAADETGRVGNILPEAAVARAARTRRRSTDSGRERQLNFTSSNETASTSKGSDASVSLSKYNNRSSPRHKRKVRSSSITSRLASDINIHPASFRQEIIEASRNSFDDIQSADDLDSPAPASPTNEFSEPNEHSPLCSTPSDGLKQTGDNGYAYHTIRQDWHARHNHNKPNKKGKGGHGHNHNDMGMRAMVLHVIGDALGNVGVIISALIIWPTHSQQRFYADPAVSLFITLIILRSAIPLTFATAKILLQATPDHLDVTDIKEDIQNIPGVVSCHHVYIWQLSDSQIIASLHIQVAFPITALSGAERYMQVSKAVRKCLHAYGIHSATIQPEFCLDSAHGHADDGLGGLDGEGSSRTPQADDCLLECVDDCVGKSCCSSKSLPAMISGGKPGSGHGDPENGSQSHSHDGHAH
ncbi:hypothetical protein V500_00937 [Pseudogymnoascus sp. VKM F-4518 (FW-2643)]|nr:hypothetical protein V500_00937 [Pseudogymnoascus sp. VKM F-4518 (FW-2643)]